MPVQPPSNPVVQLVRTCALGLSSSLSAATQRCHTPSPMSTCGSFFAVASFGRLLLCCGTLSSSIWTQLPHLPVNSTATSIGRSNCVLRTTCKTTHHDWRRLHHFIWVVRLEHGRAAKAAETYRVHRSSLWLKGHSWQLIQDAHESVVQNYNGGTWTEAFAAEGSWLRPGYESGTSTDSD